MRFHRACAYVGIIHIGLGLLAFGWHMLGARDHERSLEKLREAGL